MKAVCFLLVFAQTSFAFADKVVIVKARNNAATVRMVTAIRSKLQGKAEIAELTVENIDTLSQLSPRILVAIGPAAARAVKDLGLPFIVAGVPNPEELQLKSAAVVAMTASPEKWAQLTRVIMGGYGRVGVIERSHFEPTFTEEAKKAAFALGIELVFVSAQNEQDVPAALRKLLGRVDAFWLLPDATLLSAAATSFILRTATEYKLSAIVYTSELLTPGGIAALTPDWSDAGVAIAAQVLLLLEGKAAQAPLIQPRFLLELNTGLAESYGKPFPEVLVHANHQAY